MPCSREAVPAASIGKPAVAEKRRIDHPNIAEAGIRLTQRLERVKGIEPSYAAWEAAVLPLNYTRAGRLCKPFAVLTQSTRGRRTERVNHEVRL